MSTALAPVHTGGPFAPRRLHCKQQQSQPTEAYLRDPEGAGLDSAAVLRAQLLDQLRKLGAHLRPVWRPHVCIPGLPGGIARACIHRLCCLHSNGGPVALWSTSLGMCSQHSPGPHATEPCRILSGPLTPSGLSIRRACSRMCTAWDSVPPANTVSTGREAYCEGSLTVQRGGQRTGRWPRWRWCARSGAPPTEGGARCSAAPPRAAALSAAQVPSTQGLRSSATCSGTPCAKRLPLNEQSPSRGCLCSEQAPVCRTCVEYRLPHGEW